jgi:hypothetical protein
MPMVRNSVLSLFDDGIVSLFGLSTIHVSIMTVSRAARAWRQRVPLLP